ncbi:hypothetical protein DET50_1341, partial [Marinobacter pelagius]
RKWARKLALLKYWQSGQEYWANSIAN